ncbi:unnamed protein product [Vicia faba]|uniref:Uncharacterized protein n=1 Tax=Vicia faba TaxID=3906 RepID=A0AAV0YYU9_VICFA|nr:unnamed protein product [Vicia faba]
MNPLILPTDSPPSNLPLLPSVFIDSLPLVIDLPPSSLPSVFTRIHSSAIGFTIDSDSDSLLNQPHFSSASLIFIISFQSHLFISFIKLLACCTYSTTTRKGIGY